MTRKLRTCVFAITALLAFGCGSTVQNTAQTRLAGAAQGSLGSEPVATGRSRTSGSTAGTTTPAAASRSGLSSAPVSEPVAAVQTAAAARKRTAFRLGVVYLKGLEAAYAAVGAKSSTVDSRAATQTVVDHINKGGGIAGRKLEAYYYAIDANSSQDRATQLQAACEYFTHDRPVDIVASFTAAGIAPCLSKRNVAFVNGYPGSGTSASEFASSRLHFAPAQLSLNRLSSLLPGQLVKQHWIDARWGTEARCATVKEPRLGVVTFDRPAWREAYEKTLAPAFRAAGRPVLDVVFVQASGTTAQQLGSVSAGVQNAILKFSNDCVDHVAFVGDVALDALFMIAADQQNYRPRYGLSSLEAPPVIVQNLSDPNSQLHGAMGVGWAPFMDVNKSNFDAAARAPAQRCLDVLRKAGIVPGDNNATILAMPSCDGPFFAAAILTRFVNAGGETRLLDVVANLGSSYRASGTYATSLGATKHDGASAYRTFGYSDGCSCFRYTSGVRAL